MEFPTESGELRHVILIVILFIRQLQSIKQVVTGRFMFLDSITNRFQIFPVIRR